MRPYARCRPTWLDSGFGIQAPYSGLRSGDDEQCSKTMTPGMKTKKMPEDSGVGTVADGGVSLLLASKGGFSYDFSFF
jgi:hypothetical protein